MATSVPKFETTFILSKHGPGINVVKISPDGTRLLSGANDGTIIVWDLETGKSLQTWNLAASSGITAAVWCPMHEGRPNDAFAIGNALGSLTIYRKGQSTYDYSDAAYPFVNPVEDLAFDVKYKRLAAVGDGSLKLYCFNDPYVLSHLHGTTPHQYTARTASFYADSTCIFVCYLESQHITGYTISQWAVQFDGDIDTRIGHAALKEGGDLFVTNLMNGMDVYSFPPTPIPKRNLRFHIDKNFPLTVAASSMADFVVIGGEDGSARIYDSHLGLLAGTLAHGTQESLIQHVDMHVSLSKIVIITACADDQDGSIKMWEPMGHMQKETLTPARPLFSHSIGKKLFQVVGLMLFISRQLELYEQLEIRIH